MTPVTRSIGALSVVAALALAGCGSSSNSSSSSGSGASGSSATSTPAATSTSASSGGGHSLKLAADPNGQLKFDVTQLKASPGKVTIAFTNKSPLPHAVAIEGHGLDKKGAVITNGSNSLTVDLKKGTYTFYCPVDGHRAAGMQGTLTVG